MLIAIDASSANKPVKTGVEWHAFHLLEAMKRSALGGERIVLWSPTTLQPPLSSLPSDWESRVLSWPPKQGWMQARVSLEVLRQKPDVLFVPAQALPRILPKRSAVTLHDVAFLRRPELFDPSVRRRLKWVTRDAIHRATLIFTVSESSKKDLIEAYGIEADRVVVTPLAADLSNFRLLETKMAEPVRSRYGLQRPYFLFVGRLEAKKNVTTLIRAFSQLCEAGEKDLELVLIGSPGFGFSQIQDEIALSADPTRIREPGYVPEGDLPALMNAAEIFCFPSHEEGFGIPVLEAMACGAPVLASDIPALRETGGEAVLYAPPTDGAAWTQNLSNLLHDASLRMKMREAGLARAAEFSWDKTAALTMKMLRDMV